MEEQSRYDAKLTRILSEAAVVFAEKGYDGASIRDISAAAGVSLSGLYYYVRSKEELLYLIQRQCFQTILDQLDAALCAVSDPEQRLTLLISNHLGFFASNMSEMKVLSHEADVLSGDYAREITDQKREYSAIVSDLLRTLAPQAQSVDLRRATFSLFGMMNWIYTWYRPDRDGPVNVLATEMTHLFLRGFGSGIQRGGTERSGGRSATSMRRSV
ncbi:MAG: TetR/AcrR family transcriptional regulator [Gemmatimonadota bacterium]|nr:MAG: TetR/AcrR family transcriptional regulator [Gemmatimonadota bacterium]